jgi:deoxyadenosine/deoxycytidine kinase
MTSKSRYIIIEGNIGAGKTTLASMLAEEQNAKLVLEQFADNPFLPKFYKDPKRYSFTLELSFLAARYKQLNDEINSPDLFKPITIADYYFIKSLIFAKGTLDDDEYALYRQIFNITYAQLPKPDLYVYIHQSPDRLLQQIAKRGRDYEKNITVDYLQTIQENYFAFFKTVNDYPIVVIDSNNIDYVNNPNDYLRIANAVLEGAYGNGVNRICL